MSFWATSHVTCPTWEEDEQLCVHCHWPHLVIEGLGRCLQHNALTTSSAATIGKIYFCRSLDLSECRAQTSTFAMRSCFKHNMLHGLVYADIECNAMQGPCSILKTLIDILGCIAIQTKERAHASLWVPNEPYFCLNYNCTRAMQSECWPVVDR